MGEPRSGLSNIQKRSGLHKPDRAAVIARLTVLRTTLHKAERDKDAGKVMLTRHDIDAELEELYRCTDPAGVADPSEWGEAG